MIISWLWNMMQPEIGGACMFLTMTKEIWETVKQTYSKVQYANQIYKIRAKIHSRKQITSSIIECYNVMKGLWFELDYNQNLKMNSEDPAMFLMLIEGE